MRDLQIVWKKETFSTLLQEAQSGSQGAIEKLFCMYRPLLLRYSYVNGNFDEDLWQEQCMNLMKAIKKFRPETI